MLQNKAEVLELSIKDISDTNSSTESLLFDCTLYFTSDLYNENGKLAFNRGMKVQETNNLFVYEKINNKLKLVRLKFGETKSANNYKQEILNQ